MMNRIEYLKNNKNKWNKKTEIKLENKIFKIIGIGPKALKVLWFGPTPGTNKGAWNQCWWNYNDIDDTAKQVIDVVVEALKQKESGQTTLSL